ncbi:hypothetical protein JTE90_016341 [Oedothorax gibbosus]|uniref:Uncharacterized protein n=1 Tax=Oedothorax gibbosus TaxID=931172 RepID=A0AAV6TCX7_9ARAC|nr:hypothetical protein JTE90_016341 [Oedothorax gibbosus]
MSLEGERFVSNEHVWHWENPPSQMLLSSGIPKGPVSEVVPPKHWWQRCHHQKKRPFDPTSAQQTDSWHQQRP